MIQNYYKYSHYDNSLHSNNNNTIIVHFHKEQLMLQYNAAGSVVDNTANVACLTLQSYKNIFRPEP